MPANVCTFIGGVGAGYWSDSQNWQNAVAPAGAGDSVVFANGTNPSFVDLAVMPLAQLQLPAGYTGQLTIANNLVVNSSVSQQNGTIFVAPTVQFQTNSYNLTGGSLSGPGEVDIQSGPGGPGTMTISAATTIGVGVLNIDANSTLNLNSAITFSSTRLLNYGLTQWNAGNISLRTGAEIVNQGTFSILCDQTMTAAGAEAISNYATLTKANSDGFTMLACRYDTWQASTQTHVMSGELDLAGSGDEVGQFQIDAGTQLTLSSGVYTLNSGVSFNGSGLLDVQALATMTLLTDAIVTSTAPVQLDGNLTGPGYFDSLTSFRWIGGTVNGLRGLNLAQQFTINSALGVALTDAVLSNYGAATWSGPGDIAMTGSTFNNFGFFLIQNGQAITGGSGNLFRNAEGATLLKTNGGENSIDVVFKTEGAVYVNGLFLKFSEGLTEDGFAALTELSGGRITVDGTNYQLTAGTLRGGGDIAGTLNNGGGFVDAGVNAGCPATLNVSGDYTQSSGGSFQVAVSATQPWGLLNIGGQATLDGALFILVLGDPIQPPASGVILQASGGRQGQFANDPTPWVAAYLPNSVEIRLLETTQNWGFQVNP